MHDNYEDNPSYVCSSVHKVIIFSRTMAALMHVAAVTLGRHLSEDRALRRGCPLAEIHGAERETGPKRETKRKTRSPRQCLEMVAGVRPVLALIFVPLFAQPPRQTIYHNEGNGSFEQNSLTPGESLQQWYARPSTRPSPTFSTAFQPSLLHSFLPFFLRRWLLLLQPRASLRPPLPPPHLSPLF